LGLGMIKFLAFWFNPNFFPCFSNRGCCGQRGHGRIWKKRLSPPEAVSFPPSWKNNGKGGELLGKFLKNSWVLRPTPGPGRKELIPLEGPKNTTRIEERRGGGGGDQKTHNKKHQAQGSPFLFRKNPFRGILSGGVQDCGVFKKNTVFGLNPFVFQKLFEANNKKRFGGPLFPAPQFLPNAGTLHKGTFFQKA